MNVAGTLCLFLMLADIIVVEKALGANCEPGTKRQIPVRFPIVFKAGAQLLGARANKLQAWRLDNKSWQQMPLQVDEVDGDGSYVLDQGLPFTKFNDDGVIDINDELSINAPSLGGPISKEKIPTKLLASFARWARIDFCSSADLYLGSILIGEAIESNKSPQTISFFDSQTGTVETSKYSYRFRKEQPMLMGDVRLKTPRGDMDVFAGSSFVMPIIPKFFLFPSFYFGGEDFTSEIESWRSGPVRSIVAVGAKLKKFFSLIDLHLFSELVFYEDYFQIPTQIQFVFDPSRYLAPGSGLAYILKYPEGINWKLTSNLQPLPRHGSNVGGQNGGLQTAFERSKQGVFSVRGSSSLGSFVAHVRVDEKALKQAPPPFLASGEAFDSQDFRRSWPWLAKSRGSLGVFIEISGVKAGSYDFALDVALSNQADDGFADFQTVTAIWPDSNN